MFSNGSGDADSGLNLYERTGSQRAALSHDDVGNQARYLLNNFIIDRIVEHDHIENAPAIEALQEPGTPEGPPLSHMRDIGRALRVIGDDLDGDQNLQNLIDKISPQEANHQTISKVAKLIFEDNVFNWGRVVTLFYFAYKMALKALDKIPLIRGIVNLVISFIRDKLAPWIIDQGGWESIVDYCGTSFRQMAFVFASAAIIGGVVYLWNNR